MGKRELRHVVIREIVRTQEIKTQQELADELKKKGFDCTQTTVSRDIADIGLVKTRTGGYALPEEMRLQRFVIDTVLGVQAAGNLVVLKTTGGAASGVAAAVDSAALPGSLGTIAGDDTVFLAASSNKEAEDIVDAIMFYLGR